VAAWEATAYVAFVIDVFSRRIVGWRAARSMKTELVLDTIEMALWSRDHEGSPVEAGLIHHSDAGSQPELNRSSQHRVSVDRTVAVDRELAGKSPGCRRGGSPGGRS
jgi:putative transposase